MWFFWCVIPVLPLLPPTEIPYDGRDQDGDGRDLVDVDGDGEPSVLVGGADCNDRDPRVHSSAQDVDGDGIDQDCDGSDARRPWLRRLLR